MTNITPQQMRELADDADWLAKSFGIAKNAAIAAALRDAADQLDAVQAEVIRYAGWHEDAPEDSWRFERDIRAALGMEQYDGGDND